MVPTKYCHGCRSTHTLRLTRFYFPTSADFNEVYRDGKTRNGWEVLNICWKVKQRHPQPMGSGIEPTYIPTGRCHEIQVHTIDSQLLTHMGREERMVFFNTSPVAYMQGSSPLFPAMVSSWSLPKPILSNTALNLGHQNSASLMAMSIHLISCLNIFMACKNPFLFVSKLSFTWNYSAPPQCFP